VKPTSPGTSRRDFVATAGGLVVGSALASGDAGARERSAAGDGSTLRAGAAASNITPPLGVSLDGTIMQIGPARHIHDELHARCIVLDDGRLRVAIVVCDVTMISRDLIDRAKERVARQTGVPANRVLISATHTHMAPRMVGIGTGELDRQYEAFLIRRIADAVARAVNNLSAAKAGWVGLDKPAFVQNRRWFMKPGSIPPSPLGSKTERVMMNGRPKENRVRPAGPVDPQVSALSIQHADGRPMAVLANYGIHYAGYKPKQISSDYFGRFARRIAQLLGTDDQDPPVVGIMSNGTSGDVGRGPGGIGKVGDSVAQSVADACRKAVHRDRVSLAMRDVELELGVRRPDAARLRWARELSAKARGKKRLTRPEIYAREAIKLSAFPPKVSLKLQALRVGDLGIAAIPCEVFAETGLAIKEASPLEPTFVISLANGYNGYLPTARQHELGGYETWPARSSYLEVQAESKIRAAILDLLRETGRRGQTKS